MAFVNDLMKLLHCPCLPGGGRALATHRPELWMAAGQGVDAPCPVALFFIYGLAGGATSECASPIARADVCTTSVVASTSRAWRLWHSRYSLMTPTDHRSTALPVPSLSGCRSGHGWRRLACGFTSGNGGSDDAQAVIIKTNIVINRFFNDTLDLFCNR